MTTQIIYLVGVDGGGTGTRVLLAGVNGVEIARGQAGPSGLALGIAAAWTAIEAGLRDAISNGGLTQPPRAQMALGCGLAGVNNPDWAAQFVALDPGYAALVVETDARTNVLAAHGGKPGAMIALGTGSVAEVMLVDGGRREVGGWGFPAGDEASGAWLGWRAVSHALRVLDGRASADAFSDAVLSACGGGNDNASVGAAVLNWLAQATPTRFAQLAPVVVQYSTSADSGPAREIMLAAGREVALMAHAMDASGQLPIALCGGLAAPMRAFLPEDVAGRFVLPQSDAVVGALLLVRDYLRSRSLL